MIHISPTQKGVSYIGSQFLNRSRDHGQAWERISPDPRSKHTAEDRQVQFDLAMKLYNQLSEMTFAVGRINGIRLALEEQAAKLPADDPLRKQLQTGTAQVDALRQKIVATKEGGAITGEERLREYLATLYSDVVFYEGRPSQIQVERTDSLARELADVVKDFDAWAAQELAEVNAALAKKQLLRVEPLSRTEWEKKGEQK